MNKFGDLNQNEMNAYKGYKKHTTIATPEPMLADVTGLPDTVDWV